MTLRKTEKIPAGKLVRLEIELDGTTVRHVFVRGDFFAHPEEAFEAAEAELVGVPVAELPERAKRAFARPGLSIIGASPEDIAGLLERTIHEAQVS